MLASKKGTIREDVDNVLKLYRNDPRHRFRSWSHCFKAFRPGNSTEKDMLALHLGFYLASWGMYRGSGPLLQKDFTIHLPVVEVVTSPEWVGLYGAEARQISENLKEIISLGYKIRSAYREAIEGVSDTLVTKVILGTLGCTPAFDQFLKKGAVAWKIRGAQNFCEGSMKSILAFYDSNSEEFEGLRADLKTEGIEFPAMKILDACLWGRGKGA